MRLTMPALEAALELWLTAGLAGVTASAWLDVTRLESKPAPDRVPLLFPLPRLLKRFRPLSPAAGMMRAAASPPRRADNPPLAEPPPCLIPDSTPSSGEPEVFVLAFA